MISRGFHKALRPAFSSLGRPSDMGLSGALVGISPVQGTVGASAPVERARDSEGTAVEDVRVDHGCAHILMTEKFLNGSDVIAVLQQVRREGVPERVGAHALTQSRAQGCLPDRLLNDGLVQMMAMAHAGLAIAIVRRRREDPLPGPLQTRVRIFPRQCSRERHAPQAPRAVALVLTLDRTEMLAERMVEAPWKHGHAITLEAWSRDHVVLCHLERVSRRARSRGL